MYTEKSVNLIEKCKFIEKSGKLQKKCKIIHLKSAKLRDKSVRNTKGEVFMWPLYLSVFHSKKND